MDNTAKVDAILNTWFDYIDLDDYSNARIEVANRDKLKKDDIRLVGDCVLIPEPIFSELQHKATKNKGLKGVTAYTNTGNNTNPVAAPYLYKALVRSC